jgi:hypothetical protein
VINNQFKANALPITRLQTLDPEPKEETPRNKFDRAIIQMSEIQHQKE